MPAFGLEDWNGPEEDETKDGTDDVLNFAHDIFVLVLSLD